MAVTGFMLVGFLIAHLAGNLSLFVDKDGTAFTAYADGLHETLGPLLYVAEVGLLLLFVVHIRIAIALTLANRAARPSGYRHQPVHDSSTPASRNMFISGSVVMAFIVVHLINFRFAEGLAVPDGASLHTKVVTLLTNPLWAAIYVLGALAIGVHVSHGFRSAFQSLGVSHPRANKLAARVGWAIAALVAIGFASFPIVALISWKGQTS